MSQLSWRMQSVRIAAGYVAVFAIAAVLLFARHLAELRYPAEASGGMWAAGNLFLYVFLAALFMIPSAFLIWSLAKFENYYVVYSRFLLGLSLTAPICLAVVWMGRHRMAESLANLTVCRFFVAPFVALGIAFSRLVARSVRAKRLTTYALLVELLTFGAAIALLIHSMDARPGGVSAHDSRSRNKIELSSDLPRL